MKIRTSTIIISILLILFIGSLFSYDFFTLVGIKDQTLRFENANPQTTYLEFYNENQLLTNAKIKVWDLTNCASDRYFPSCICQTEPPKLYPELDNNMCCSISMSDRYCRAKGGIYISDTGVNQCKASSSYVPQSLDFYIGDRIILSYNILQGGEQLSDNFADLVNAFCYPNIGNYTACLTGEEDCTVSETECSFPIQAKIDNDCKASVKIDIVNFERSEVVFQTKDQESQVIDLNNQIMGDSEVNIIIEDNQTVEEEVNDGIIEKVNQELSASEILCENTGGIYEGSDCNCGSKHYDLTLGCTDSDHSIWSEIWNDPFGLYNQFKTTITLIIIALLSIILLILLKY